MKQELSIVLSPEDESNQDIVKQIVAKNIRVRISEITFIKIIKRSIDARSRNVKINLKLEIYINEQVPVSPSYKKNYPENGIIKG